MTADEREAHLSQIQHIGTREALRKLWESIHQDENTQKSNAMGAKRPKEPFS